MKSFLGGCGINDKQDCSESSFEPNPLYGGSVYNKIIFIYEFQHQNSASQLKGCCQPLLLIAVNQLPSYQLSLSGKNKYFVSV